MADTNNPGSKSKSLPNFYSAVGGMDRYSGKQPPASPATSAADSGEKVKNVTTLLEVIKKMDAQESDPDNKKLLEQVAGLVEQYMTKLQPGGDKAKTGAPTGGEAGAGAGAGAGGGSVSGSGGGGATMGDTTAASAAM
jgi:hypothetical protein